MRARACALLLLLLLAARGFGAVLFENGLFVIGAKDCTLRRTVHLDRAQRVWAEADGLKGARMDQAPAAPEVFLDDEYLGPLDGGGRHDWRSPRALDLAAGDHVLLVRCAQGGDAATLSVGRLRVIGDALQTRERPPKPRRRALVGGPCGDLPLSTAWPARLHGQGLVLSVLSGRVSSAGDLARLRDGESWQCRVRLPEGRGDALPLMIQVGQGPKGQARVLLALDRDYRGPADALGYTPGAWEPLRFWLCAGQLHVSLSHAPDLSVPWDAKELRLELAASDVEVGLKPY